MEELRKYVEDKLFITGISGSGKTFITDKVIEMDTSRNILRLDDVNDSNIMDFYNNCTNVEYITHYFHLLPERFVLDGIPFVSKNNTMDLSLFRNYAFFNKVKIICLVPSDQKEWEQRMANKSINTVAAGSFLDFAMFYFRVLPMIAYLDIDYFDTCKQEYITLNELYHRISWIKMMLDFLY